MNSRHSRLIVGAPFLAFSIAALLARLRDWAPQADMAIFWLRLHDMPEHIPLYGAYSRFQWHHPGPAMYYAFWPIQQILGSNPASLLTITLLWHGVALSIGTWLAVRVAGRKFGVAYIIGSCGLALGVGATEMMTPWNPYFNVFVFPAFILAAWALARRDKSGLFFTVVLGSLLIQNHVGLAVPVGMVAVAAVAIAVLDGGLSTLRQAMSIKQFAVAALAGGLMWAPPVIEQLVNSPGNFGLLARFFRAPTTEPAVGFRNAAGIVSQYLGVDSPWMFGKLSVEMFGGGVVRRALSDPAGWPIVGVLATVVLWCGTPRRKWRSLALLLIVGVLAAVVAVARIAGTPYPYLLVWVDGLAMLFGVSAATVLLNALLARTARVPAPVGRTIATTAAVIAVAITCVVITRAPNPYGDREPIVTSLAAQVIDDLGSIGIRPGDEIPVSFEPAGSNEGRTFITGLMVQLELAGYHTVAHVDEEVGLGTHRVATPPPRGWGYIITDGAASVADFSKKADLVKVAEVDQFAPGEKEKLAAMEVAVEKAKANPGRTEFERNINAAAVVELIAFRANRLDVAVFRKRNP